MPFKHSSICGVKCPLEVTMLSLSFLIDAAVWTGFAEFTKVNQNDLSFSKDYFSSSYLLLLLIQLFFLHLKSIQQCYLTSYDQVYTLHRSLHLNEYLLYYEKRLKCKNQELN